MLKKILTLRFEEVPDYDAIIKSIKDIQDRNSLLTKNIP